jgi:hypothetical protein
VDGVDEVALGGQHDEVDGVEVLLGAEAAAQVGTGVDGGERLAAARADEGEPSLPAFARPVQVVGDETFQGDVVPQAIAG